METGFCLALPTRGRREGGGVSVPLPQGGARELTPLLSLPVRQNIFPCEQTTLPAVSVSERVLGSVGRWLDSLPRALRPRVQDTVTGSSYWNCPRV